ncbi:MAG TPA: tryptophanase [Gemmataceae bacterium]|nr:tryptophanase [Gemmataceae bacterium]
MKTIIEPFKIKMVEPIKLTTREQREAILRTAHFNVFQVPAEDVIIDLLTDSGTSAMSSEQWAGIMRGDESYAGARSWYHFERVLHELTGMAHVLPTHQGRASERILFELIGGPDKVIPSNNHFDTTRANIEHSGARAVDLVIEEGTQPRSRHPFKGNLDPRKLVALIADVGAERVPVCMVTVTNNSGGGQPVSLANLREVRAICERYAIPLFLDACRFAENAYLIKQREPGQQERTPRDIAREMFDLADGATISAKKDGLVNIGGVLLMRDDRLAERANNLLILTEGFVTYGGLAGRDLEAMAQGFVEVLDEDYLQYRLRSVAYLGEHLLGAGVQIVEPPGGHAIYIDAAAFCSHIPAAQFPGQALVCALYRHAGIRAVEIGSVMFGRVDPDTGESSHPPMELVRLAIPRRVYTQSHIDYVIEATAEVFRQRERIRGLRIIEEPQALRHFTAKFEEV